MTLYVCFMSELSSLTEGEPVGPGRRNGLVHHPAFAVAKVSMLVVIEAFIDFQQKGQIVQFGNV